MTPKKTHRCKGSLKEGVSIRYENPYFPLDKKLPQWWLEKAERDYEWDSYFVQVLMPIKYCPFCGEELK